MTPQPPDDGGIRDFVVRQVLHNVRCGACGCRYGDGDVTIVDHQEAIWVLMAICPGCDSRATVLVVVQERPAVDDTALTMDDVLDFHASVADYLGDLRSLLGPSER
ncbi:MAG: hypothetical protein ACYC5O_04565 [Anaerolineae bacterium]